MTHPFMAWLTGNDEEASRAYDFVAQRPFWKARWFLIVLIVLIAAGIICLGLALSGSG